MGSVITKVSAGGGTHAISSSFYGTCSTTENGSTKEVIINDPNITEVNFTIGMTLAVKFSYKSTMLFPAPTLVCYNNSGTIANPIKGSVQLLESKPIYLFNTGTPSGLMGSS